MSRNIWDKKSFKLSIAREKCKPIAAIKQIGTCIRYSRQRIVRGYADCDWWDMYTYLQRVIADMLQDMRDHHIGSPAYLGESRIDENGIEVHDHCHEEWDKILDRMIFLWREADESTCSKKNPYEEEYFSGGEKLRKKYYEEEEKIESYRSMCKDEALDMLKEYFYDLWD